MIKEIIFAGKDGEKGALKKLAELGFDEPSQALNNLALLSKGPLGKSIELVTDSALSSPSPSGALNNLERVVSVLEPRSARSLAKDAGALKALITVCGSSPFLVSILLTERDCLERLFLNGGLSESKALETFLSELEKAASGVEDFDSMARTLRAYRRREFLRIGSRDLLGAAGLVETTRELSDLAAASLESATRFASKELKKTYGTPIYTDYDGVEREAEFTVIGLGKLGGRELNFSSDIDILYIYSSDAGETTGTKEDEKSRVSLHAYFVKLSTMITKLISTVTAEGFVFRVDLDLRPEGPSGAMANSLTSMESYYESWGQTWERAAMIKARPVAGSQDLGEEFLNIIRPFVFRKYLDFTAIEEIKSMKEKINLSLKRRKADAVDVKLGKGGIREVEFVCQALQLIHAGKDTELREKNTLKAIERLRERGLISDRDVEALSEGYVFLRNLEHRIQIVENRQTQAVPARPAELERLARMMGFYLSEGRTAAERFWAAYRKRTAEVHNVFRSLFYGAEEESELEEIAEEILHLLSPEIGVEEAKETLASLGFRNPEGALDNLSNLRGGPAYLKLGARSRIILTKLAPMLLKEAAGSPDPDKALQHLESFLTAVGARTTLYSLLYENPGVARELLKIFGTSEFLSRTLIEHPESLDIFLARELSTPYKPREDFTDEFLSEVLSDADYEEKLDNLRRLRNQEVFRIGINDIQGLLTPHQVSVQMTFLAEAALEGAYRLALMELSSRYGSPPEGTRFCILGLGKLGGRELIYGSDLDIIFVYEDVVGGGVTDGPKVISSHEFYIKLCQRIISILSVRTKEGVIFNVDARLRPSGSAGPLVLSSSAFINYHTGDTQVWERQALTRSRAVAANSAFGAGVLEKVRDVILAKPLKKEDIGELLRVRKRMENEIAREDSTRYNIKTGRGGIVDIEFLVQTLQLKHGRAIESLRTPHTLKALTRLKREKILSYDDFTTLRNAYNFYRLLEKNLRIVHDRPEGILRIGSEELITLARGAGYTGKDPAGSLIKDYSIYADKVREIYTRTLERL